MNVKSEYVVLWYVEGKILHDTPNKYAMSPPSGTWVPAIDHLLEFAGGVGQYLREAGKNHHS